MVIGVECCGFCFELGFGVCVGFEYDDEVGDKVVKKFVGVGKVLIVVCDVWVEFCSVCEGVCVVGR